MIFGIITLITALSMASIAAWFAIAGIMAVFAGAPVAALVMGSVIELGKVVGVSWIYRNLKERTLIKYVLGPLVIVAMLLTSMGIFGFLSKAHLEQTTPVGNNTATIERLDQRIAREQKKVDDAELVIAQLDDQVAVLIEYSKISGPDGSRAVRAGQEEQRTALSETIDAAEDKIADFEDQKFELSSELRELELEVGPVKYIAELIYEDAETNIEAAVRVVIIAFIFVFDPMAIVLLMAANHSLMRNRKPKPEPVPGGDLIDIIDEINEDVDEEIIDDDTESFDAEDLQNIINADPEKFDAALDKINSLAARRELTAEEIASRSTLRSIAERQKVNQAVRRGQGTIRVED